MRNAKTTSMASVVKDVGEIWGRLFDHRPFVQGEVTFFLREFQDKRGDREVENIFAILEHTTELSQSQIDRAVQLGDNHLPSLKNNVDVALSMCESILRKEDSLKNEEKLNVNREARKIEWERFVNDMNEETQKVDKVLKKKEQELKEYYLDVEQKLHITQ